MQNLNYPGGRAIKIAAISTVGSNTRLKVTEPQTDEVFKTCDFGVAFAPDVTQIVDLYNARETTELNQSGYNVNSTSVSRNGIKLKVGDDNSVAVSLENSKWKDSNSEVTVNGELKFKFGRIKAEFSGLNSWTDWASTEVNMPMTVTSELSVVGELKAELPILLTVIPLPGPLPGVYVEIPVYFTIGIKGEIEIGISQKYNLSSGFKQTFLPFNKTVANFNGKREEGSVDLNVTLSGKAVFQVVPRFKVVGYDTASLTFEFGVGAKAKRELSECPNTDITAHYIIVLEAKFGQWNAKKSIMDDKNSPITDYYYNPNTNKVMKGKCLHGKCVCEACGKEDCGVLKINIAHTLVKTVIAPSANQNHALKKALLGNARKVLVIFAAKEIPAITMIVVCIAKRETAQSAIRRIARNTLTAPHPNRGVAVTAVQEIATTNAVWRVKANNVHAFPSALNNKSQSYSNTWSE